MGFIPAGHRYDHHPPLSTRPQAKSPLTPSLFMSSVFLMKGRCCFKVGQISYSIKNAEMKKVRDVPLLFDQLVYMSVNTIQLESICDIIFVTNIGFDIAHSRSRSSLCVVLKAPFLSHS